MSVVRGHWSRFIQRLANSRGIVLQLSNAATEQGKDNAVVKTAREKYTLLTHPPTLTCLQDVHLVLHWIFVWQQGRQLFDVMYSVCQCKICFKTINKKKYMNKNYKRESLESQSSAFLLSSEFADQALCSWTSRIQYSPPISFSMAYFIKDTHKQRRKLAPAICQTS